MRRLPRRPLNAGFVPPREYFRDGLFEPGGRTVRPALLGELAAGLGRQLLIEQVPLETVDQCLQALLAAGRLAGDGRDMRRRLAELAANPAITRYPLLAQVLSAGVAHVHQPDELQALAAHLRRALMLASFTRVLAGATAMELERQARRAAVSKGRQPRKH